jgi:hypothetical protein
MVPTFPFVGLYESHISSLGNPKTESFHSEIGIMGEAIGWLMEASEELNVVIPRQKLSKLVTLIYKEYAGRPLNFQDRKHLAYTAVRVLQVVNDK